MMQQNTTDLKRITSKYVRVLKFRSQKENVLGCHLIADESLLFSPGSSGEFTSLPFPASTGFGPFLPLQSYGV